MKIYKSVTGIHSCWKHPTSGCTNVCASFCFLIQNINIVVSVASVEAKLQTTSLTQPRAEAPTV